ncbi:glycoside hydrolase family 99-like domain-containing protein [Vibrio echinoideorum]|uniref:glycoside hydrolase family 99-like domain-containing protein n=1 Tax=Vibrio echinoideorum TaxID=2100116 RepID=UPI00354FAB8D
MVKQNNSVVVSSPNGGGLFIIRDKQAIKIDNFNTTGLFLSKSLFLRGKQPETFVYYESGTTFEYHSYDKFNDIHDVLFHDGSIYIVCTTGNFVIKVNEKGEELHRWSYDGENDSRHINCLAVWNGRVVFSAFGDFSKNREYKNKAKNAGYVEDLLSGERLIDNLSQPHSPIANGENLIIASSENYEIHEYSKKNKLLRKKYMGGYTRGLCLAGDILYVGLSVSRNNKQHSNSSAILVGLNIITWEEVFRIPLSSNEIYSVVEFEDTNTLVDTLIAISSNVTKESGRLESEIEKLTESLNVSNQQQSKLSDNNEELQEKQECLKTKVSEICINNSRLNDKNECLEIELVHIKNSLYWRLLSPLRDVITSMKKNSPKASEITKAKFDAQYYLSMYSDIEAASVDPFEHYVCFGWKEGRSPTSWFDTEFYLETYKDVKEANVEPFEHYLTRGKNEGRVTCKQAEQVIHDSGENLIKSSFDSEYYLEHNVDVKDVGMDPFEHYIVAGWKEGRSPNRWFDTKYYLCSNKDVKDANIEPLEHYLTIGKNEGRKCLNYTELVNRESTEYLLRPELNTDYKKFKENETVDNKLKLVAFYLPQFHAFPENDEWWGTGFTEWTNVSKAQPNFIGHYQPHLPIHLGFYDLMNPEVMVEQAKLAKNYGIKGFNFYYYWFDGKILMHKPFDILLNNKDIDIDFCITWANENWSRRWDGAEHDILIAQNHCKQDSIDFIENLYKYFRDERYIRVDNKPVLIVYRSDIIPNMERTINLWREKVKEAGFDGIYLICSQTFGVSSPDEFGFDAAMEFPPHTATSGIYNHKVNLVNKNFTGNIYDYKEVVDNACKVDEPEYKKFRTAMLSWDNTARKQNNGHIFDNFSIAQYQKWLSHLSNSVMDNSKYSDDEKFVFINAWNEWAEGTHLEPDRKFGYSYLQATYDVQSQSNTKKKIIYVCHDAFFSGAQLLSLNIIKTLHETFKLDVHLLLLKGGVLEKEFENYATVYYLDRNYKSHEEKISLITNLYNIGAERAICNTVVSGEVLRLLSELGIYTISLIHELPNLINEHGLLGHAELISEHADKIIFPANYVKEKFSDLTNLDNNKVLVCPQGLYQVNRYQQDLSEAKRELREKLCIKHDAKIVLGVGYGDYRKGVDIFIDVASKTCAKRSDTHFVWVGDLHPEIRKYIEEHVDFNNFNIIFVPAQSDISLYYTGADIYLMTSREDPFPSVVMEAMNAEVPVVGFEDAGGFSDIVTSKTGKLVPFEDSVLMTKSVLELLDDSAEIWKLGRASSKLIKENFVWKDYIYNLLEYVGLPYKKISVILPNYNYEEHIEARLNSIQEQSYPVYELIYLDDCSRDNSLKIARNFHEKTHLDMAIYENSQNSGSVFRQWSKGITSSNGDYIWIAEADDLCSPDFLSEVVKGFDYQDVILSYSQSKQIDESGRVTSDSYLNYTSSIDDAKWCDNYLLDGKVELSESLSIKNTIPNVSAVVFRKIEISPILEELLTFKVAGDWYFYSYLLERGRIHYNSESLNYHRRHVRSVTVNEDNNLQHFNEIVKMQDIVASSVDLTQQRKQQALDYRQEVKKYLNLA